MDCNKSHTVRVVAATSATTAAAAAAAAAAAYITLTTDTTMADARMNVVAEAKWGPWATVTVVCGESDNEGEVQISEPAVRLSVVLKDMLDDVGGLTLYAPNCRANIFSHVARFSEYHAKHALNVASAAPPPVSNTSDDNDDDDAAGAPPVVIDMNSPDAAAQLLAPLVKKIEDCERPVCCTECTQWDDTFITSLIDHHVPGPDDDKFDDDGIGGGGGGGGGAGATDKTAAVEAPMTDTAMGVEAVAEIKEEKAKETAVVALSEEEKEAEVRKKKNISLVFALIMAANYLDNKLITDVSCRYIASLIRGKTAAQIRDQFGLVNTFTPEEEAEIDRELAWMNEDVTRASD